jgi:hypothetical protein
LHSILQILSVNVFEKVPIDQLLTTSLTRDQNPSDSNQLMLWDL